MTNRKEQVHQLKNLFNLNLYEARLWTVLLKRGEASAGELSKLSEVPRSRSYDILESLEKKGFILVKIGKPIVYTAVHPNEIIERFKRNVKQETSRRIDDIDHIRQDSIYQELVEMYSFSNNANNNKTDLTGMKGRANIYLKLSEMIKTANTQVLVMTTSKGFLRKAKELEDAFRHAKENGARIRILAPINNEKYDNKLFEIRNNQELNTRIVLIDSSQVMMMLNSDENYFDNDEQGILIKSDYLNKSFTNIFEKYWNF